MHSQKSKFTLADFELGLMLGGYISPKDEAELTLREELEQADKAEAQKKKKEFFKRSVLAAEIVNRLHEEPTFGRVKFQKILYLCENVVDIHVGVKYDKFAAGPFDSKFMHYIIPIFRKQKWFDVEKKERRGITRSVYKPLENYAAYVPYYNRYFKGSDKAIQRIISIFRSQKTRDVELVATIYACWLENMTCHSQFSEKQILETFYAWSDSKKKFKEPEVIQKMEWMKEMSITPASV